MKVTLLTESFGFSITFSHPLALQARQVLHLFSPYSFMYLNSSMLLFLITRILDFITPFFFLFPSRAWRYLFLVVFLLSELHWNRCSEFMMKFWLQKKKNTDVWVNKIHSLELMGKTVRSTEYSQFCNSRFTF